MAWQTALLCSTPKFGMEHERGAAGARQIKVAYGFVDTFDDLHLKKSVNPTVQR